jgi:integrase
MKLTKSRIDAFRYEGDGKSRDLRWDDAVSGLGLRVYPSGRKAFVLSYRTQGRKRLLTLGEYGPLTLDKARDLAQRRKAEVIEGKDPLEARQSAAGAKTVGELCRVYLERYAIHKRTAGEDKRRIEQHILPRWANRKVESLKRAEIAEAHHKVGQDWPYEANRRLSLVRGMFNLARQWGFVDEGWPNPASGIPMHPEQSRDRWVTKDELPRLAEGIDQEPNVYVRSALWLYLLTGMRKRELLGARWDDIDWDRRELRLGETKTGRPHYVPLSPPAIAILQATPRQELNPYIFCGARKGKHLVNIDICWSKVRERAGVPDVRLHDLRRTVGSWLAQAGNDLHLIGKVLNHSNLSTTQVYARFSQDVVHKALEDHGARIMAAAGKGKPAEVVPLKPRG